MTVRIHTADGGCDIVTPRRTFEATPADFRELFANITVSWSYRGSCVDYYPTVPHRAERFLQK